MAAVAILGLTGAILAGVVLTAPARADQSPPEPPSSGTPEPPTVSAVQIPTPNAQSYPTGLLDGGVAVGYDFREAGSRFEPWVYRAGARRELSTPAGIGGSVSFAARAGYAAGTILQGGTYHAVRWRLADGSMQRLDDWPFSGVGGLNAAGDAVVTGTPTTDGNSRVDVVPVRGKAFTLAPSTNALGLSARRQAVLYDDRPDGTPRWFLAGRKHRDRLPWKAAADCYLPVNDTGYLVYQRDPNEAVQAARLREPSGRLRDTGLFVDCEAHATLSANGRVVGVSGAARDHAAMWFRGGFTDLGAPPGGLNPYPAAVNDAGDVLVTYYLRSDPEEPRIALWRAGHWLELPLPAEASGSRVVRLVGAGLNDMGQALGSYQTAEPESAVKAVLWTVNS